MINKTFVNILPVKATIDSNYYYDGIVITLTTNGVNTSLFFKDRGSFSKPCKYTILDGTHIGETGNIYNSISFPANSEPYRIKITNVDNFEQIMSYPLLCVQMDKNNLSTLADTTSLVKIRNIRFEGDVYTQDIAKYCPNLEYAYCFDNLKGDIKELGVLTRLTDLYISNANGQHNSTYGEILDFVKEQIKHGRTEVTSSSPMKLYYSKSGNFYFNGVKASQNLKLLHWYISEGVCYVTYEEEDHTFSMTANFNVADLS